MIAEIDPRSPTPLYDQIAMRIRVAVAAGDLRAGDPLPSVRQLAGRLRVNPATVVQAYRQLETDGFVEMRQGSGTFVREVGGERKKVEQRQHARKLVRRLMAQAAGVGLKPEELLEAFHEELGRRSA
jgi:GntR family transcriptional regulator